MTFIKEDRVREIFQKVMDKHKDDPSRLRRALAHKREMIDAMVSKELQAMVKPYVEEARVMEQAESVNQTIRQEEKLSEIEKRGGAIIYHVFARWSVPGVRMGDTPTERTREGGYETSYDKAVQTAKQLADNMGKRLAPTFKFRSGIGQYGSFYDPTSSIYIEIVSIQEGSNDDK